MTERAVPARRPGWSRTGQARRTPRAGALAVAAVVAAASGCGTGATRAVDAGPAPTRPSTTTTVPPPTASGAAPAPTVAPTTTIATTSVSVWLVRGGALQVLSRRVPRVARVGAEAVKALLAGPTAEEARAGTVTAIPAGTRLLGLEITGGVARVDLSGGFEASGTGDRSLGLRLAQVTCTLDQFDSVDAVAFSLDGRSVSVIRGDGTVADRPVSCDNYRELLTPPPSTLTG